MASRMIKNFIDYLNSCDLITKIAGRNIYILGAYNDSIYIAEELLKNGVKIKGFIESKKQITEYNGYNVFPFPVLDTLENRFLIVPQKNGIEEIKRVLSAKEMKEEQDYIICKKSIQTRFVSGRYEDIYGNIIEISDYKLCCPIEVTFEGYCNKLVIGKNANLFNSIFIFEYGSSVYIGNNTDILCTAVTCKFFSTIIIGNECKIGMNIGNREYKAGEDIHSEIYCRSLLKIGDKCTSGRDLSIVADFDSPITIGNDCMFSYPVRIRSNNSHALYDITACENISTSKEHYVKIGNHVWIGENTMVLFNADIGDNCIIGAGSIVKDKIESNSVAVGVPAKVIKSNCTWGRKFHCDFNEYMT